MRTAGLLPQATRARAPATRNASTAVRWDDARGQRIHSQVAIGGPGAQPVVLLHGIGVSSRYLMPTAVELVPAFEAFVPDLPGFGQSPAVGGRRDIATLAAALGDWIDAVGLDRPALVAHSFGCQIAVDLAVTRPEQLSTLVLVAPTVDRRHRSFLAQASRLALDACREPLRLYPVVAVDYTIFMRRGGLRFVRPALADRLEAKLPAVAQPTLVVRGSRDPVVTQRWTEDVAALLPNGTLQVVEGAPHAVNFAQPRALAELISRFLGDQQGLEAGSTTTD